MLLAIDTATRWTGLALHDGTQVVAALGWHASHTQTVELAPTVADLLRRTQTPVTRLQALAVTIGPGSYTGLRVGLAFAKGMALAHGLPLLGIGTLDVVVAGFGQATGHLVAIAEAGRTRVCAATYRWYSRKGWQVKQPADIFAWDELLAHVPTGSTFAGEIDAAARKLIRAAGRDLRSVSPALNERRASHLAELALTRLRRDDRDDPVALAPIYLREPGGARPAPAPISAGDDDRDDPDDSP